MSSRSVLVLAFVATTGLAAEGDRLVVNAESSYPEGPLVDGGTLYYAEMGNDRVMAWDGTENRVVWSRKGCGPTSVMRAGEGALNVLCHYAHSIARISPSGETLKIIDRDSAGVAFITPNASVNDARGGAYFSSSGAFAPERGSDGAVLYLDRDDRLVRVAEGIHYSNGVALSPDGTTLYVSEHLSRNILAYDVGADGSLSGRRLFVALDDLVGAESGRGWEVGPDGLAVDRSGNLYVAEYGAGRFLIIAPDGRLLSEVSVPERYVTGVALSPDETRIFVTAPANRMIPLTGKVYSVANPLSR